MTPFIKIQVEFDFKRCNFGLLIIFPTDSGDGESADPFSLKNKTLNDESMPLPVPGLSTDGEEAEDNLDEGSEPTLFIEKMVSGKSHTAITRIL